LALKSQLSNQNIVDSSVLHKIRREAQGFGRGETPSRGQKDGKSAMVYWYCLNIGVCFVFWHHEEHPFFFQNY